MRQAIKNVAIGTGIGIAAAAVIVHFKTRADESAHPPVGKFITVDGVRLHYIEEGSGNPIILIHGNAMMVQDFITSGLVKRLAATNRVIAFDRPGFGYSDRPRTKSWSADRQGELLAQALTALGITSAVIVGHSIGTQIALAMALDHPSVANRLVLLSGYYYPETRMDAMLATPTTWPVVGDIYRYTVGPLVASAMASTAVKAMFAPEEPEARFSSEFPIALISRPVQLGASAGDAAQMMATAATQSSRYGELKMPVAIMAGAEDKIVDPDGHAVRLHGDVAGSSLQILPRTGHMVHHTHPDQVIEAIAVTTPL